MAESFRYKEETSGKALLRNPPSNAGLLAPSLQQYEATSIKERLDVYTPLTYSISAKDVDGNRLYRTELVLNKATDAFSSQRPANQCHKCRSDINLDRDSRVTFKDRSYHSQCFTCGNCHRTLADSSNKQLSTHSNGEPLCSRCDVNDSKTCAGCQRPILAERSLNFDGKTYHGDCFRCGQCNRLITEDQGLHIRDLKPCCDDCYNRHFAPQCAECLKPIHTGKITSYKTKQYHPDCFRCGQCNRMITEREFFTKDSKPCCDACYRDRVASHCNRCQKPILDEKSTIYESKPYHIDCFRCGQCDQRIQEREFFSKDGKPCCNACYRDRFAQRCFNCQKLILDGKSTIYDSKPYHPECFRCGQCNRTITEREFFTKDSKPCCDQCYRDRFAPRCSNCQQLILDGKSTVHNNKSYHPDCFRCGQCNKVVVEREFYTHEGKPCCNTCYRDRVSPLCFKCNRPILGKCSIFQGKNYHPDCFTCMKCHRPIDSSEKFYNEKSGILCLRCGA